MNTLDNQSTKLVLQLDDWYYGKDGQQYRAVYGNVTIRKADELFGFKMAAGNANWYAQIGEGDGAIYIAGCRIHYVTACDTPPVGNHVLIIN
jgi:hypothetical protein